MQEEGDKLSSKNEHAAIVATARARAAKQEYILKGPKAGTHSATMPAYAYTRLCPDPKRRTGPTCATAKKKVQGA